MRQDRGWLDSPAGQAASVNPSLGPNKDEAPRPLPGLVSCPYRCGWAERYSRRVPDGHAFGQRCLQGESNKGSEPLTHDPTRAEGRALIPLEVLLNLLSLLSRLPTLKSRQHTDLRVPWGFLSG